jgi:hypothetical protein
MILLLLACLQDRWSFDADPAGVSGRPTFLESPIAGGGRLLQLNGVDARVELDAPAGGLSLWFLAYDLKPAVLLSRSGSSLELLPDGSLRAGGTASKPGVVAPGQWHHLAVLDGAVHVDGTAVLGPVGFKDSGPLALGGPPFFSGLVDEVRIVKGPFDRAWLKEGLPWFACPADRTKPFDAFADEDVVAVVGGEDAFAAMESGHLAAALMASRPRTPIHVRSLAWEGDSVHEQWRIHNFGNWERQLARAGAVTVLAWFGKTEALQGPEGVPAFRAAYAKLLDAFAVRTRRLILVAPTPFERLEPPLPDPARHNASLALYVDAVRALAAERGALFLQPSAGATRDGVHLTDAGHQAVARSLFGAEPPARLVELCREQNRAWMRYWRPDNWAFLAGDRVSQPSSRDHLDARVRWFPGEVQSFLALVRAREREIRSGAGR